MFIVGGWLTHGDSTMEARVDFVAVIEHRLISARVRGEWVRQKGKGFAPVWAPASQGSSRVGDAGGEWVGEVDGWVGEWGGGVSTKGALVSFPTLATAQFESFFGCGRAVRCLLPSGQSRFMHLVVLYGSQGAESNAEQIRLIEQVFDLASGELLLVVSLA